MESKFLRIILVSLFLFSVFSFASADRTVKFSFYEGKELANGSKTVYTDHLISGVTLETYSCLNVECSLVGSKIDALSKTASGNNMDVTFPTEMPNGFGYLVYFYHDDYFGVEDKLSVSGTSSTISPASVFLYQKEGANIPIDDFKFNAINTRTTNVSFVVDLSHILRNGTVYPNLQKANNSLSENVKTDLFFRVFDSNNVKIYETKKTINVEYGNNTQTASFNYAFNIVGNYNVEVETKIVDKQLFNTVSNISTKPIKIISNVANNYSYSTISSSVSALNVNVGENFQYNVTHASFYVDEFGVTTASNSIIVYKIKDVSGTVVYNSTVNRIAGTYEFDYTFVNAGNYTTNVNVCAQNVPGALTCSSETKTIVVSVVSDKSKSREDKEDSKIISKAGTYFSDFIEDNSESKENETIENFDSTSNEVDFPVEEVLIFTLSAGIVAVAIKLLLLLL